MAFMHGRMDEAAHWFLAATRARPGSARSWTQLALVYDQLGRPADADSALAGAARAEPENPGVLYYLAWFRAPRRLVRIAPRYPRAWTLLGQVCEDLKLLQEARESYARAARGGGSAGDVEQGQRGLARIAFLTEKPEDALAPLQGLLATNPADTHMRRLRCELLARLHRDAEALADADTLAALEPDNILWAALKADLLSRKGELDRARDVVAGFARSHPGHYRSYELLANMEMRRRHLDDALTEAGRARELAPDSASVHYLVGQVLAEMGRNAAAESALTVAIGLDSAFIPAHFALGVVRERQGRLEASEAAFRSVLRLDPRNAQARNYLGYMYVDRGLKLQESLQEIELALREDPRNSAYLDSRGWAYYRLGRLEEARADLEAAVRNGGGDPVIQEHLGDVLASMKLFRLAEQAYQEASSRDPGNSGLKQKLRSAQDQQK
ncbi:MAG: tetratricopeptide repeat protein [Candidatus Eisenbacteria bacterium]|nr:tetratricopeptide repeat protein [Candidatus Eisenbacteria bacterium]